MGHYGTRAPYRYAPYAVAAGYLYNKWKGGSKTGLGDKTGRPFSMTGTMTKRRTTGDSGTTTQFDKKRQYTKKRMPKRQRRKWVRFVKKVKAVADSQIRMKNLVLNSQAVASMSGTQPQNWCAVHLYAANGSNDGTVGEPSEAGTLDLRRLINADPELSNAKSAQIHMKSAVIDITMTNLLLNNETTQTGSNTLEVDVYKLVYGRNDKDVASLEACLTQGALITDPMSGSEGSITSRGVTPFDLSGFISTGKIKILSKTKYLISPGQCATLLHRDPKNRYVDMQDIPITGDATDFTYKNHTVSYMFVAKVIGAIATGTTPKLNVRCTRSYHYKTQVRELNTFQQSYVSY